MPRREFLKTAATCGVDHTLPKRVRPARECFQQIRSTAGWFHEPNPTDLIPRNFIWREMRYRTLGRTGERISAIGLGGFHIGKPRLTDDDSIRLIRTAIDRGITFMDNSWDYHEGQSEVRRTLRASMIPLMPSPGKPKTVSTPQSISGSTRTSAAVINDAPSKMISWAKGPRLS